MIGTLIFTLILMLGLTTIITIFGYYNNYNNQLLQYDQSVRQEDQTSLSLSGVTFGATPDTVASSTASSVSYIPITLTNSQTSATSSTFQQKITFNPSSYSGSEASNLGNIRFCTTSSCSTELYAWLESCISSCTPSATSASVWVKLTSSIGASGGTLTIYMVFESTSTNFDGNYWGEAPNLSGTYGQYDNGANVFTFYDNFAGTTLSSKWTTVESSGGSISVNNGITFTTASSTDYAFIVSAVQTEPLVAESNMVSGSSVNPMIGVSTTANFNSWAALYNGYSLDETSSLIELISEQSSGGTSVTNQAVSQINFGIWQIVWPATGTESATDGVNTLTGTSSTPTIANYRIYVGQSNYSAGSNVIRWARMRAYPPQNVMPSVSFGSASGSSTGTAYSFQRKVIYSQGLWWAFYSDGTDIGYSTSPDGSIWSSETVITSSTGASEGFDFNIWVSGSTIYYVLGAADQSASFFWQYGTLQASGMINWAISQTSVATTNKVNSYDSIVTDSSGNVWVALNTYDGTNTHIEVWKYSAGTWAKEDDISPLASDIVPVLVPLANGIALIYGEGSITSAVHVITTTTGATWSTAVSPPSDYELFSSSATAMGNTLYFAGLASTSTGVNTGTVNFWSFAYGASSTSSETQLQISSSPWVVSISSDPSDTLLVFYGSGTTLSMVDSTNFGNAWSTAQILSSGETSITGLSSTYSGTGVIWTSGGSSPFSIRFSAIPLITTTNSSPFSVHLISLYIYNTVTGALVHFDTNSSATGVTGSFNFEVSPSEQISIPLSYFTWTTSENYLITIATDQGVLESIALTSPS